ncbi:MAG TPA: response regulator [Gemmatimonadales bacterium]|nr:response regulator [Gemmatimonadales bacterium]
MPTVLLVDDEPAIRRVLRALFERAGLAVLEARSGSDALALLAERADVDAVVSDVVMPEVSGLAFYDRLIERLPGLAGRVVFLTGAARDPTIHGPIEERGVPLVSKIDDLRIVVDAVKVALLRPAARRADGGAGS